MGFSADWLALRAPADRAARDPGLMAQAVSGLGDEPVVLDLGCGTGATADAFAELLPGARWRFVDQDPDLLARARTAHPGAEIHAMDLRDPEALPWDGVSLVTCSALLDLMPQNWAAALTRAIARRRLNLYAALSYDGVMTWDPGLPADPQVTTWFNRHQRGDRGLGPALGPEAHAATARAFAALGYAVHTAQSPWRLGPDQAALQHDLLRGIGAAAAEAGFEDAQSWTDARRAAIPASNSIIGHVDLLAVAPVM